MTRSTVLASILLLASASAAHSQNTWRDILEVPMTVFGDRATELGYRADPDAFHTDMIVGILYSETSVGLEVDLDLGVEYWIFGACDLDCTDLDLTLSDIQGNKLFEDILDDATPILSFTAPASGEYFLRVSMVECSAEPCSFGYKVYRR
jgi:hypothetical protein